MEILPPLGRMDRRCAAAYLGAMVDAELNRDAINEAACATDALQGIGSGPQEYKVFNTFGEVSFEPQEMLCQLCRDKVSLSADGSIDAPDCSPSGSCEVLWATMHPDEYLGADGEPLARKLPCRGGGGGSGTCGVLVGLKKGSDDSLDVSALVGVCPIDVNGDRSAMEKGLQTLAKAQPRVWGENEIEPYDGV
jgi:hypothetical protein